MSGTEVSFPGSPGAPAVEAIPSSAPYEGVADLTLQVQPPVPLGVGPTECNALDGDHSDVARDSPDADQELVEGKREGPTRRLSSPLTMTRIEESVWTSGRIDGNILRMSDEERDRYAITLNSDGQSYRQLQPSILSNVTDLFVESKRARSEMYSQQKNSKNRPTALNEALLTAIKTRKQDIQKINEYDLSIGAARVTFPPHPELPSGPEMIKLESKRKRPLPPHPISDPNAPSKPPRSKDRPVAYSNAAAEAALHEWVGSPLALYQQQQAKHKDLEQRLGARHRPRTVLRARTARLAENRSASISTSAQSKAQWVATSNNLSSWTGLFPSDTFAKIAERAGLRPLGAEPLCSSGQEVSITDQLLAKVNENQAVAPQVTNSSTSPDNDFDTEDRAEAKLERVRAVDATDVGQAWERAERIRLQQLRANAESRKRVWTLPSILGIPRTETETMPKPGPKQATTGSTDSSKEDADIEPDRIAYLHQMLAKHRAETTRPGSRSKRPVIPSGPIATRTRPLGLQQQDPSGLPHLKVSSGLQQWWQTQISPIEDALATIRAESTGFASAHSSAQQVEQSAEPSDKSASGLAASIPPHDSTSKTRESVTPCEEAAPVIASKMGHLRISISPSDMASPDSATPSDPMYSFATAPIPFRSPQHLIEAMSSMNTRPVLQPTSNLQTPSSSPSAATAQSTAVTPLPPSNSTTLPLRPASRTSAVLTLALAKRSLDLALAPIESGLLPDSNPIATTSTPSAESIASEDNISTISQPAPVHPNVQILADDQSVVDQVCSSPNEQTSEDTSPIESETRDENMLCESPPEEAHHAGSSFAVTSLCNNRQHSEEYLSALAALEDDECPGLLSTVLGYEYERPESRAELATRLNSALHSIEHEKSIARKGAEARIRMLLLEGYVRNWEAHHRRPFASRGDVGARRRQAQQLRALLSQEVAAESAIDADWEAAVDPDHILQALTSGDDSPAVPSIHAQNDCDVGLLPEEPDLPLDNVTIHSSNVRASSTTPPSGLRPVSTRGSRPASRASTDGASTLAHSSLVSGSDEEASRRAALVVFRMLQREHREVLNLPRLLKDAASLGIKLPAALVDSCAIFLRHLQQHGRFASRTATAVRARSEKNAAAPAFSTSQRGARGLRPSTAPESGAFKCGTANHVPAPSAVAQSKWAKLALSQYVPLHSQASSRSNTLIALSSSRAVTAEMKQAKSALNASSIEGSASVNVDNENPLCTLTFEQFYKFFWRSAGWEAYLKDQHRREQAKASPSTVSSRRSAVSSTSKGSKSTLRSTQALELPLTLAAPALGRARAIDLLIKASGAAPDRANDEESRSNRQAVESSQDRTVVASFARESVKSTQIATPNIPSPDLLSPSPSSPLPPPATVSTTPKKDALLEKGLIAVHQSLCDKAGDETAPSRPRTAEEERARALERFIACVLRQESGQDVTSAPPSSSKALDDAPKSSSETSSALLVHEDAIRWRKDESHRLHHYYQKRLQSISSATTQPMKLEEGMLLSNYTIGADSNVERVAHNPPDSQESTPLSENAVVPRVTHSSAGSRPRSRIPASAPPQPLRSNESVALQGPSSAPSGSFFRDLEARASARAALEHHSLAELWEPCRERAKAAVEVATGVASGDTDAESRVLQRDPGYVAPPVEVRVGFIRPAVARLRELWKRREAESSSTKELKQFRLMHEETSFVAEPHGSGAASRLHGSVESQPDETVRAAVELLSRHGDEFVSNLEALDDLELEDAFDKIRALLNAREAEDARQRELREQERQRRLNEAKEREAKKEKRAHLIKAALVVSDATGQIGESLKTKLFLNLMESVAPQGAGSASQAVGGRDDDGSSDLSSADEDSESDADQESSIRSSEVENRRVDFQLPSPTSHQHASPDESRQMPSSGTVPQDPETEQKRSQSELKALRKKLKNLRGQLCLDCRVEIYVQKRLLEERLQRDREREYEEAKAEGRALSAASESLFIRPIDTSSIPNPRKLRYPSEDVTADLSDDLKRCPDCWSVVPCIEYTEEDVIAAVRAQKRLLPNQLRIREPDTASPFTPLSSGAPSSGDTTPLRKTFKMPWMTGAMLTSPTAGVTSPQPETSPDSPALARRRSISMSITTSQDDSDRFRARSSVRPETVLATDTKTAVGAVTSRVLPLVQYETVEELVERIVALENDEALLQ